MQSTFSFQHADGRYALLRRYPLRIDCARGGGGDDPSYVFTQFTSLQATDRALAKQTSALTQGGFRPVKQIRGYVAVPVSAWRRSDMPAPGRPTRADVPRARKKMKVARARTSSPRPFRTPMRTLVATLRSRVDVLASDENIVVRAKWPRPVSALALARANKRLGVVLPPSLAQFLALHDGLVVRWTSTTRPWEVSFELQSLAAMLDALAERKTALTLPDGQVLLPLFPRFDRSALGVALAPGRSEACVVEIVDPPDGRTTVLATSFGAFLQQAAKDWFIVRGCSDETEGHLPEIGRTLRRSANRRDRTP